jgi:flagellar biosynthetic protein FlhB
MAEQEQDRSEQATPFKLEQARRRGTVAMSPDMVSAAALLGLVLYLYWLSAAGAQGQLELARAVLGQAGRLEFSAAAVLGFVGRMLLESALALAPLFALLAIIGILGNLAQTGPVFSFKPLTPDFGRLNPANGFKRLFSLQVVYDLLKTVLKLVLLGSVLALSLRALLDPLLGLLHAEPVSYARRILEMSASLAAKLALAIFVLALLDVAYVRWAFARRMRMSRRELRNEVKQREGDPRVRARLRQLRLELLKRSRAANKVASADVLVTNPTHVAVAVAYKHGEMPAPRIVAKGAGELASKMRAIAWRHRIPVVQHAPLARALYRRVAHDEFVPEEFYPQVLKILVWVYTLREARAAQAGTA